MLECVRTRHIRDTRCGPVRFDSVARPLCRNPGGFAESSLTITFAPRAPRLIYVQQLDFGWKDRCKPNGGYRCEVEVMKTYPFYENQPQVPRSKIQFGNVGGKASYSIKILNSPDEVDLPVGLRLSPPHADCNTIGNMKYVNYNVSDLSECVDMVGTAEQ